MEQIITYVGMDVHKKDISIAVADGGRRDGARYLGVVPNTEASLTKLSVKLSSKGQVLHFCYEAGPCGYGVHRHLNGLGHDCAVVAPSLIPRKPGERVKTDRRDAVKLATLHRAGELTPVWVPDADHEAMRDLVRARGAAMRAVRRARQQLTGFLLRHQRHFGGKNWTLAHRRWLSTVRFDHPAQQIVLQDYIHAVEDAEARHDALLKQVEALVPQWSLGSVVMALQAMRGIALIVAATLVAEVGDLTRFDHPRQLMAYLGLVPGERSSGDTVRRGGITKAGNSEARRVMIEAAWTYRMQARIGRARLARLEGLPKKIRDIAWKAEVRLCARWHRMKAKGKLTNVVAAATAREILGFAWDIARHVTPRATA